ncbi:hypothetical protein MTP99_012395 [Tenebrio molitor]|nr:hypothetical protein MTP99_012395 [Tenebrio molitor]
MERPVSSVVYFTINKSNTNIRNFQSFDSKSAVSGNIYESNPYLNPTVPYSGDVYGGSGQEVRDYNAPGGEFEDEPPLLEELGINPEFIVQKPEVRSRNIIL